MGLRSSGLTWWFPADACVQLLEVRDRLSRRHVDVVGCTDALVEIRERTRRIWSPLPIDLAVIAANTFEFSLHCYCQFSLCGRAGRRGDGSC